MTPTSASPPSVRHGTAPATPPIRLGGSWLASQGKLPLAFMAVGIGWFAAAAGLTAFAAGTLALPHLVPPVVAIMHAWILGFCVTIAVGAMYQLAPVALSTTLHSERTGWWHLALHGVAVPAMIVGFWRWQLTWVAGGGLVVFAGVTLFAVNSWRTIYRSGKRDAVAWSLTLATGWLLLTVVAGLLLVANRMWGLWPVDPLPLLRAHAHLGLVGFFLTLLQGVTFRLVPMFTLGEVPSWRPVRVGLWLSQLGLVLLAPALAYHWQAISALAGASVVAGMLASGWALKLTLATRKKRQLDVGVRALGRGFVVLGVAALGGVWLAFPNTRGSSAPGGFGATTYGMLLVIGGLLPAIAGMMGKIVPFLTWMRAYGPKVGRMPTPPATSLSHPRLEAWALDLQAIAILPLLIGAWTLVPLWLFVGATLLACGVLLFVINMAGIFRHLWRPITATAPVIPPLSR